MGSSYSRLNVVVCGINPRSEEIINRLFPQIIEGNKRKLEKSDDKILYTARIFNGSIANEGNLNRIKDYINQNFDHIQNDRNSFPKNIVIYFSDENDTIQQSSQNWVRLANKINTLPELKLPFILFLGYGNIDDIRNQIQRENEDIFGDFRDKRKITILRLSRGENELNYRKILSYLWKMTLILNQKPFQLSKNPEANLDRIEEEVPTSTINFILTGFTRKGKSTFINMAFDKIVTLENPSFLPVTSEIIEFLLPSQHDENGNSKGGLKLYDVPGLIEGTTDNMSNIIKLVEKSIRDQEINFDVINYILFFLSPAPNFTNTLDFLRRLNNYRIKIIFIINRDQPRNNGRANTTKETLIDHLRSRGLNNLLVGNGNNILEVDLINGVQGRTNEIFRYIYNDFRNNNEFNDNVINEINQLPNQQLFPYLHNHFEFFSEISSIDDFIQRGNIRSNIIIGSTIPTIIAAGFYPIPFVDVPIFLLLTALMLIGIFRVYGFNINIEFFRNFFNFFNRANENNENRNEVNDNDNERLAITTRILNWLSQNLINVMNDNVRFIIEQLIQVFLFRIGISAFLGFLDFIPGFGFIIGGVINFFINTPFIKNIGKKTKNFCSNKIRDSGGRQNILNFLEGYKDSVSILESLSNKNEWRRKIQILNN